MKHYFLLLILSSVFVMANARQNSMPVAEAQVISGSLKMDGLLNETEWSGQAGVSNFWCNFPADTALAKSQSVVKVLYNEEFLYIGATLFNTNPVHRYVASSLRRDYPFAENDAFGVLLDTYLDQTNGYGFYVSAYGVQREEQIFGGTTTDGTWDAKWFSAVSHDSMSWTVEMAIPFKYVRFKEGVNNWNANFVRNDIANNQRSSWAAVPRNFLLTSLAYHGQITWPDAPEKVEKSYSIIPSVTYTAAQTGSENVKSNIKLSLDGKVSITSALNLDVTINPDFSQAEVDQVQLNITRFELVFPEKRFFFIENSDLFSEFGITQTGTSPIRPFYSRRIGLRYNAQLGQYERTQLLGGLRLSGKLNKNLRVGVMSVQTAKLETKNENGVAEQEFPGQNYSVIALQQKVFARSNIGVIVENRQGTQPDSISEFSFNKNDYSRLIGAEYNLASADSKWSGKAFTHYMWDNENKVQNAQGLFISRNTQRSVSYIGYTKASREFNPAMGFAPRNNFTNFYTEADIRFYPKNPESKFNFIAPIGHYDLYLDSLNKKTDNQIRYGLYITFKNTAYMYILGWQEYTRLFADFNPSQNDGLMLKAGTVHKYASGSIYYETDFRKNRFGTIWFRAGEYFNGNYITGTVNLNQKIQPWGIVGLTFDYNNIRLPEPYSSNTIYAAGPKAELSFSKSLFFNTILQYNSQTENLNYYARLQWRFRPLSDLYVIFTNNHLTQPWQRQNQALTVKLVYWL